MYVAVTFGIFIRYHGDRYLVTKGDRYLVTKGDRYLVTKGDRYLVTKGDRYLVTKGDRYLVTKGDRYLVTKGDRYLVTVDRRLPQVEHPLRALSGTLTMCAKCKSLSDLTPTLVHLLQPPPRNQNNTILWFTYTTWTRDISAWFDWSEHADLPLDCIRTCAVLLMMGTARNKMHFVVAARNCKSFETQPNCAGNI